MRIGDEERSLSGNELHTTNNRMELTAAIRALQQLEEPCEVHAFLDSTYVINGITHPIAKRRLAGFARRVKNGEGVHELQPVPNADLWRELDLAAAPHSITWEWVRGHDGHDLNELADFLAETAREALEPSEEKGLWRR